MKIITLVEVNAGLPVKGGYLGQTEIDPLGLEYLAAVLIQAGHQAHIVKQFPGEQAKNLVRRILLQNPDVVAFGPFTYSYYYAISIARCIRRQLPDICIVFGGVHVSSVPEIVDYQIVNYSVCGEGEITFRELVDCLDRTGNPRGIAGVAYWDKGFNKAESRSRIENLDNLPFPYRQVDIIKRTRLNSIMYPAPSRQKGVCSVQYGRGCPYGCPYCASRNVWGREIQWRSAGNVVDEIERLQCEHESNTLFFTDLTFNALRSRVVEVCQEMRRRVVGVFWQAMLRMAAPDGQLLVDPQLLQLMHEAGCRKISYGLESISEPIQQAFNKAASLEAVRQALEWTSNVGILTKAYLMLGEPYLENRASIEETMRILPTLAIDELRLGFFTPFPGTVVAQGYADRLITDDWSRFTSEEPLLTPINAEIRELVLWREKLFFSFYGSSQYRRRVLDKIAAFPELEESFADFFANTLKTHGLTIKL